MVGFALETEDLGENAARKLKEKGFQLIAANSALEEGAGPVSSTRIRDQLGRGDIESAAGDADIVVEAVVENLEVKTDLFRKLDEVVPKGAILASNTSSLSISRIGDGVPGPERLVGLHFFNPVHIMSLVEVVRGDRTTERVLERARAFVELHVEQGPVLEREGITIGAVEGGGVSRLALSDAEEILERDPRDLEALRLWAFTKRELGDFEAARGAFDPGRHRDGDLHRCFVR